MGSLAADPSHTQQIPMLATRASVGTIDEERRTVELVFSTGAPVERFDWWTGKRFIEKLSLKPAHIRLDRLNSGAPLLNTHNAYAIEDQIGVVEDGSVRLTKTEARATVRFSRNDDVEKIWQNVKDRIVRNVSVGYRVHKFEEDAGDNKIPVRTAIDWEPYEISMVPMPADFGAQTRDADQDLLNPCVLVTRVSPTQEPTPMPENQPAESIVERNPLDPGAPITVPAPAPVATEPNDRERGIVAERERVNGIRNACVAALIPRDIEQRLIDSGMSLVQAQGEVFEELRKRGYDRSGPANGVAPRVEVGTDAMIHVREGIKDALLHRIAPHFFPLSDVGRRYRGMNLMDVGRAYLQASGVRVTELTPNQLAGAALGLDTRGVGLHSTSDFPLLLADVSNKLLRKAYDEAPQTFQPMARKVTIPNYRFVNRMQLGDAPALVEIKEHGEYTSGTMSEGRERYQLKKYGRKFGITREAMINDDTQAFSDVPQAFGRKARTLESDLVWEQITSNPTMGDGNALFSIAHGNLATTDAAIDISSLGAARAALRNQTGLDGERLNIGTKFLIVPPGLETLADQFTAVITTPATAPNGIPAFIRNLVVISDPRLTSTAEWYVAASPDQIAWLEYAYLEGEEGPQTESRIGFDIDGVEFKCRLDFAAKVIDWRGIYKNEGAT